MQWSLAISIARDSKAQENMSVMQYHTKLKRLWDELACLIPIPQCSSGAAKSVTDLTSFNYLMQFLMGLNDVFDHVRNKIYHRPTV